MKHYDHILIGTGQATGTLLGTLESQGERVAVIEGHKIGGSCVNYGCTPTKTLVASARAIHQSRRGKEFGFSAEPKVDFGRVMERMDDIRSASNEGMADWIKDSDVFDLYRGEARFVENKVIEINEERIQGKYIYLNVGTRARIPDLEGLKEVPWLDMEGLLGLKELPQHLIILGGGYVGVEMAQVFRRLGSEVTIVQRNAYLMPKEDEAFSDMINEILENEGVNVMTDQNATAVEERNGEIRLSAKGPDEMKTISGSHLLIAIGRVPNSDTLQLEHTDIETDDKGFIVVDDRCQTDVPNVFAVGDVNGHGAFTHTSVNDAEIVVDHLMGGDRSLRDRIPIYSLFTDPPLGRVGYSEKQAKEEGYSLMKATMPMSKISRAKEMSETRGMAQILLDADSDLIIGASIMGPGGDEIINMFAAIMHSEIPCHEYRKVVFVHPTVSELMPYVLDNLEPAQ